MGDMIANQRIEKRRKNEDVKLIAEEAVAKGKRRIRFLNYIVP